MTEIPETQRDAGRLDDLLRDAGYHVTEVGMARWRALLSQPMPPAALDHGRQLREQYGIHPIG